MCPEKIVGPLLLLLLLLVLLLLLLLLLLLGLLLVKTPGILAEGRLRISLS